VVKADVFPKTGIVNSPKLSTVAEYPGPTLHRFGEVDISPAGPSLLAERDRPFGANGGIDTRRYAVRFAP